MSDKSFKRAIIIGAVLGAVAALAIAVALDYAFSDTLKSTWWDAAQKDATKMFGPELGRNRLVIGSMLGVVMLFLAGVGAVFGMLTGVLIHRFFTFLLK
jgi:hypothetical protein